MVMTVESPQNELVKNVTALAQKKERDKKGVLLVEGLHPLEEALKANLTVYQFFFQEGFTHTLVFTDATLEIITSARAMAKMATTDTAPPCLGTVEKPTEPTLESLLSPTCLLLVLDRIQDPGNMGTLIRSARAFGATGVVLTAGCVDPYSPKVIRASAGLVFGLPVISSERPLTEILTSIATHNVTAYLTDSHPPNATPYAQANFTQASAVVLGNEGGGIHSTVETLPTHTAPQTVQWLTIPMVAGVESLNVAVSGSIILAAAHAQRTA